MTPIPPTSRKAEPMTPKTPSKRWRATYLRATIAYSSERATYAAVNELAKNVAAHERGNKVTIEHWENGRWVLYERAVITENGWEPA